MKKPAFKYKGIEYADVRQIIDAALKLKGKEQELFVKAFYRKSGKFARSNMGYISGYYSTQTSRRIRRAFKTTHPIFGSY